MSEEALFAAISRNDRLEIERLLRENPKLQLARKAGRSPLHVAVESALPATVLAVLHSSPAVNAKVGSSDESPNDPKVDWTALHIACARGNQQIVEMLLSQPDIDVGARTPDGKTARELAEKSPRPSLVALFSDHQERKSRMTKPSW